MNLYLSISFFLFLLFVAISAELTVDEVRKLSISELKKRLKAKGLSCNGCAEKDDFVKLYASHQNLPDVVVEESKPATSSSSSDSGSTGSESEKNIAAEEVMAALKASGISGAKIYTKEEIEKMTKMDGSPKSRKSKSKKSKAMPKKKAKSEATGESTGEL